MFLTEDRGKKRGVAKNASKSRRRFGGGLDPLTSGRVTYVEREGRELVRLDRIEPKQTPFARLTGGPMTTRPASSDTRAILPSSSMSGRPMAPRTNSVPAGRRGRRRPLSRRRDRRARALLRVLADAAGGRVSRSRCLSALRPAIARRGRRPHRERARLRLRHVRACRTASVERRSGAFARRRQPTPRDVGASAPPPSILREIEQVHHVLITWHLEKELRSARVVRELRPA